MHNARTSTTVLLTRGMLTALLTWPSIFFIPASQATPDLSKLSFSPALIEDGGEGPFAAIPAARQSGADAEEVTQQAIRRYQENIAAAETTYGPYHARISEDALALATLYKRMGDHQNALAAYDRAFHVIRVNRGLYTPGQAQILRGMIDSYLALDEVEKAHEKQQYLYYVQRKNLKSNDPELLSAMLDWADWNASLHFQNGRRGPTLRRHDSLGPVRAYASPHLVEAQKLYYEVLDQLADQDSIGDPRLINTERKLATLNFMVNEELDALLRSVPVSMGYDQNYSNMGEMSPVRAAHFHSGSDALKRALAYSYSVPDPEYATVAERIMELADWYLLYDRRAAALELYQEAFTLLKAASVSDSEIERIMSPGMQVQAPALEKLSSYRGGRHYKGYVDVEFDLNKFGMASSPAIIETSTGTDAQIETELLRTIRNCRYRPRVVAGAPTDQEKVRLRYYYTW